MRISGWSSDVCSSDLRPRGRPAGRRGAAHALQAAGGRRCRRARSAARAPAAAVVVRPVQGGRAVAAFRAARGQPLARSEEHTSELQSLMRISYAVFCLKKKKYTTKRESARIVTSMTTGIVTITTEYREHYK